MRKTLMVNARANPRPVQHDSIIRDDMTQSQLRWLSQSIHEWVMSHINESCHICALIQGLCNMTQSYMTWLIHIPYDSFMCDRHDSLTCAVTGVWYVSFICYTIYFKYTMTEASQHPPWSIRALIQGLCHLTYVYATWIICTWQTWLIDMSHDSLMCHMTHWYGIWLIDVEHDSSIDAMTESSQHLAD